MELHRRYRFREERIRKYVHRRLNWVNMNNNRVPDTVSRTNPKRRVSDALSEFRYSRS